MLNNIAGVLAPASTVYNSYESIQTVTVGAGGQASISLTSIPQTFKHLQLRYTALSSGTYSADDILRFNSDSAANYSWHELTGDGANPHAYAGANASTMIAAMTPDATYPVSAIVDILDYQNTSKYKTIRSLWGIDRNGSGYVALNSGSWRSTSAVTTITLAPNTGNWNQYSQFALYGIKG